MNLCEREKILIRKIRTTGGEKKTKIVSVAGGLHQSGLHEQSHGIRGIRRMHEITESFVEGGALLETRIDRKDCREIQGSEDRGDACPSRNSYQNDSRSQFEQRGTNFRDNRRNKGKS